MYILKCRTMAAYVKRCALYCEIVLYCKPFWYQITFLAALPHSCFWTTIAQIWSSHRPYKCKALLVLSICRRQLCPTSFGTSLSCPTCLVYETLTICHITWILWHLLWGTNSIVINHLLLNKLMCELMRVLFCLYIKCIKYIFNVKFIQCIILSGLNLFSGLIYKLAKTLIM